MKILAIDTSNQPLAVALFENGKMVTKRETNQTKNHSLQLLPLIDEMTKEVNWQPSDLNRVVVAKGPGSYTGVRIGVTTAKTLASTLNIELVAVSSLLVLVTNVKQEDVLVVPIFDARNENLYTGVYENNISILDDRHSNINKLIEYLKNTTKNIVVVGEYENFKDKLINDFEDRVSFFADNLPHAENLAKIGENLDIVTDPDRFVPSYLRVSQAEADWQVAHPDEIGQEYVEEVK